MSSVRTGLLRYLVPCVAVGLLAVGSAGATIINVYPGGSIQAAIYSASDGDEVVVAPGTYHQCIEFLGRGITVRSTDPHDAAVVAGTIIDGDYPGMPVVAFEAGEGSDDVLAGFTIQNGQASVGGGIRCGMDSSPTIEHNIIRDNMADGGGGIYCGPNSSPTMEHNIIRGNGANRGGGICCDQSWPTVEHNTIVWNSAGEGGGIWWQDWPPGSPPTVVNSIIAYSFSGGGIFGGGGDFPLVRYCNVFGNSGGEYVGMPDLTGKEGNIREEPFFAESLSGGEDLHLSSIGGRWDPLASEWVIDSVHSPCIDAGDPASDCSNEPSPNGGRANMGAYGNTAQASRTPNVAPTLTWAGGPGFLRDGHAPNTGQPKSTKFTFRVMVTDPDGRPPLRMIVRLQRLEDGRRWRKLRTLRLQAVSGSWAGGMVCEAKHTLPNGVHRYSFHVVDEAGAVATGEPTKWCRAPRMIAPAQLWCTGLPGRVEDHLTPQRGTAGETNFRFSVQCTDGEGDPPVRRRIRIQKRRADGTWARFCNEAVTTWSGRLRSGRFYHFQRTLKAGRYRYRFVFADDDGPATGSDSAGADATQWQLGPVVRKATATTIASSRGAMVTSLAAMPSPGGTEIVFSLSAPMAVDARILNIAGRPVKTLCRAKDCEAGTNTLVWNAQSDTGLTTPLGTYVVEVRGRASDGSTTRAIAPLRLAR